MTTQQVYSNNIDRPPLFKTSQSDPGPQPPQSPEAGSPEEDDDDTPEHKNVEPEVKGPRSKKRQRIPHSLVERRYRENLNHNLDTLRRALPKLRDYDATPSAGPSSASSGRVATKAIIIAAAVDYINQLQAERLRLQSTVVGLRQRIMFIQQLAQREGRDLGDFTSNAYNELMSG